jgi:hypothetical protein
MKNFISLKVKHSGIHFKGLYYYHPKLLCYMGINVLVIPENEILKVYGCNGVFICRAKADLFTEKTA